MPPPLRRHVARLAATISEVLYGMAVHDMLRQLTRTRGSMEHLFILITLGDLLGVPILPPYCSLRLLRERDVVDLLG